MMAHHVLRTDLYEELIIYSKRSVKWIQNSMLLSTMDES